MNYRHLPIEERSCIRNYDADGSRDRTAARQEYLHRHTQVQSPHTSFAS